MTDYSLVNNLDIVLDQVYSWSRKQKFRGYNKHDALNSIFLKIVLGWNKWCRILAIQAIMRFPINLRPFLLSTRTYNPKGLALFAQGLLDRYKCHRRNEFLDDARNLLDLLLEIRSPGQWSGSCWGYHYPWQDPGFYAPTNTPNAVVTCFVCESFLDAYEVTKESKYLSTVQDALNFLSNDLVKLKDTDTELCYSYMPLPMQMRVMDVSILIASVLARYSQLSKTTSYLDDAERLVTYVATKQTEYCAWFYTDPPNDSHIKHDNYHTGFILDALWRYMRATDDFKFEDIYWSGLKFYADSLFNRDGSPRWMSDKDFPHDIHGAAQGIITFCRHLDKYPDLSRRIAAWALNNMYNGEGRFYYQQTRYYTKRFTLLRWCNAWMANALAKLNLELSRQN